MMVDTVSTTMGNDQDDWEVAVDTGEFDKRLEQQEKDRAAKQESISIPSTVNDDDNRNSSSMNLIKSNKPIRILKRPTSQSQLPVSNDTSNSNRTIATTATAPDNNSPFSNTISSSTTVPVISIISRNQTKESINSPQITNSSSSSSSQSTKPSMKTYEQRELEYRLARLRIMGEEESSTKDDDTDNANLATTSIPSDESTKTTPSLKTIDSFQSSVQNNSRPDSYVSNLYAPSNTNTGLIHFTPNSNSTESFSQQQYRGAYPVPYSQIPLATSIRYPTDTLYMSSSNYPLQPSSNPLYHYQQQQQQTPYGTQQYGQPQ